MPTPPPATATESGYHATVAALAVGQIVCWAALYYAFSAFVLPMQHETGWSKPLMMGAFTLGLSLWGACSYLVGAAIDRGHGRAVMTLGSVAAALGFALWSLAESPWQLYAAWALLGGAMAMTLYEPAFTVLTRRFPTRFREGITTLTLVGGLASTLAFPAVAALNAAFGWRAALAVIAGVLLLAIAPLHAWALRGPSMAAVTADAQGQLASDATLRGAVASRAFWALAATFTLYSFAGAAMWAHVMPALAAKGLSETQALTVLVWFGPAQVAARLLFLMLGRRVGLRALGLVVLAGLPLGFTLFALTDSLAGLIGFAVLFGIANGLIALVRGGLVPEYFGRSALGRIGGALSAAALLARAAAPLATAWLLLALPGYRELLLVLAALGLLGMASFALARKPGS